MHAVMRDNSPSAALDAVQCSLALEQWARTHGGNVNRALNACLTVLRNTQFAEFASHGMPCIKCDDSGVWIRQGVAIHDQPYPVCSCFRAAAVAPDNGVPVAGNAARRH
jgi:hypothetical protein